MSESADLADPFSLPDDLVFLVGRVVTLAARFEYMLRFLLVPLLDKPDANLTAAGKQAGWLIDKCMKAARANQAISETERTELFGYLETAKELLETRNDLVHGVLLIDTTSVVDGVPTKVTTLGTKRGNPRHVTTVSYEHAQTVAEQLIATTAAIHAWTFQVLTPEIERTHLAEGGPWQQQK